MGPHGQALSLGGEARPRPADALAVFRGRPHQDAKKELLEYVTFEHTDNVLDTVKPVALIRANVPARHKADDGDIVFDFFGGSGSTGHAVLVQNAEDEGTGVSFLFSFPSHCQTREGAHNDRRHLARSACDG